jgi:hypothetical protein
MLGQVQSKQGIQDALRQYGVAPGGQKMMEKEQEAAQLAIQTGECDQNARALGQKR